jgi:hypothetical protein
MRPSPKLNGPRRSASQRQGGSNIENFAMNRKRKTIKDTTSLGLLLVIA